MSNDTLFIDPQSEEFARKRLGGVIKDVDKIVAQSLNKGAGEGRKLAIQEVLKDINIERRRLAGSSRFNQKAAIEGPSQNRRNKATPRKLTANISARKRGFRLFNFIDVTSIPSVGFVRGDSTPIRVQVKPGGSTKEITNAFLVRLNAGEDGVRPIGIFVRENGRLKHLYGPSPSQVWQSERVTVAPKVAQVAQLALFDNTTKLLRKQGL